MRSSCRASSASSACTAFWRDSSERSPSRKEPRRSSLRVRLAWNRTASSSSRVSRFMASWISTSRRARSVWRCWMRSRRMRSWLRR